MSLYVSGIVRHPFHACSAPRHGFFPCICGSRLTLIEEWCDWDWIE